MHLQRRRLGEAQQLGVMEGALHRGPPLDRDLLAQWFRGAIECGGWGLAFRVAYIEDLAADIAGHPDLVHLDRPRPAHRDLNDLGEIAAMAEVERHAHPGAPG